MSASPPGWSADGNWFWDGLRWNDAISPDGKWRFDGREWKPFGGQRSLMPEQPLQAAPPQSPAPLAAPVVPAPNLPSWVAQSEVERLAQEQRDREQLAAQAALPQVPLPPELDWRRVGEHMEFHHQERVYASWQVGALSVILFLVLWWFCLPASLYFITRTGWRFTNKVIVAVVAIFLPILLAFVIIGLGGARPSS
jgi:4-amino-4-deoxy-L-arabinose transferase-like glycosyltransferase